MFFVIRFIIAWAFYLIFANKKRWREIFPTCFFASFVAEFTDNAFIRFFKLWDYHGANDFIKFVLNDFSVYMVVTYLFIQWIPQKRSTGRMLLYWFVWSDFALALEWLHLATGHMEYFHHWNLGYSYLADWFLFWLFYQYHKIFRLKGIHHR